MFKLRRFDATTGLTTDQLMEDGPGRPVTTRREAEQVLASLRRYAGTAVAFALIETPEPDAPEAPKIVDPYERRDGDVIRAKSVGSVREHGLLPGGEYIVLGGTTDGTTSGTLYKLRRYGTERVMRGMFPAEAFEVN